jgi:protein TonB
MRLGICIASSVIILARFGANAAIPQPARPIGKPTEWVTADDYPRPALRAAVGGSVNFTLKIDADGKVSDCTVTESSGNQSLDDATCALMLARARFLPASNTDGQPIAGTFHSRLSWAIPDNGPIPLAASQSVMQTVSFNVGSDGKFDSCIAEGAIPTWIGVVEQLCDRLPAMNVRFAPEKSQRTRHVIITVKMDVTSGNH